MGSRMITTKDVHTLVPRTCDCCHQGDFADVTKAVDLEIGRRSETVCVGQYTP